MGIPLAELPMTRIYDAIACQYIIDLHKEISMIYTRAYRGAHPRIISASIIIIKRIRFVRPKTKNSAGVLLYCRTGWLRIVIDQFNKYCLRDVVVVNICRVSAGYHAGV